MSITAISRDWGVDPCIVRITDDANLATITATGYLAAQANNIEALNNGAFQWELTDYILISYANGTGFFTRNASTESLVAAPSAPGSLPDTLADGNIFVGSALNVAQGVTMTGDATIDNAGVLTIENDAITTPKIDDEAVTLAKLAPGIEPSHVIKFGGQLTTVGGAAAEAFTVTGAVAATDRAFVQVVDNGTNNVTVLQAVVTNNTLTVTFSADPGADCIFNYQLIRAVS